MREIIYFIIIFIQILCNNDLFLLKPNTISIAGSNTMNMVQKTKHGASLEYNNAKLNKIWITSICVVEYAWGPKVKAPGGASNSIYILWFGVCFLKTMSKKFHSHPHESDTSSTLTSQLNLHIYIHFWALSSAWNLPFAIWMFFWRQKQVPLSPAWNHSRQHFV